MTMLDPCCSDLGQWQLAGAHGQCPDCTDVVPVSSIAAHVGWHIGLLRSYFGAGTSSDRVIELYDGAPGEMLQAAQELQITQLRMGQA